MTSWPPPLMESSRAVLKLLASEGPITRPRLGALLSLSKPTMSAAVAELDALGLVAAQGSRKGALGRTAKLYGLGPAVGYVIGLDIGAAQIRGLAQRLDGEHLAAVEEPITDGRVAEHVRRAADRLMSDLRRAGLPLRAVAAAVPRIVSARTVGQHDGPEMPLSRLREVIAAPVIVENNVNCAAIGERHYGMAKGRETFAYLQVGLRIGLGLVVQNRLFRGAGGAAGEVGRMPFPWSDAETPTREGLEHYLGSAALMERCRALWPRSEGAPPASAKDLFERALAGSEAAKRAVTRHAQDIGRLVAACVGLMDPGLVVLGGGVGQNPILVEEVAKVATELTWPTQIVASPLGDRGTVLGVTKLAADYSLGLLVNEERHPAVVLPPLV